VHQRIARRAYELFHGRDGWGDAFGDWLRAELELVTRPAAELREHDGTFIVKVAMPGFNAKEIAVDITPREIVIKGAAEHKQTEDKGQVVRSEFTTGEVFRSLRFPKEVDAAKANAEYQNGMLKITVPIAAEAKAKRVDIKAA
jgi:HSP20 family protein